MSVIKKTRQQVIEELEAKLKKLKSEEAEQKLDRTSPGMDQLLTAIEVVTKENNCLRCSEVCLTDQEDRSEDRTSNQEETCGQVSGR